MGLLTIESNASSSPDLINLTGQAGPVAAPSPSNNSPIATYTLSQGSLTFPLTPVGTSSPPQTVTLLNAGTVPLHLLSAFTPPDFAVQTTCATVLPAASCKLSVTSIPQSPGPHIAALQLASDSTTSLDFISLLATATTASLSVSPSSLDFGSILLGSSAALPVQVVNNGSASVVFTGISTTGDYAPTGDCPAPGDSLPAGQGCTIQITFMPTQAGPRPGLLSIATNASADPFTVSLTGVSSQSHLIAAPSSLNFGSVVLGASIQLPLTITNTGTAPVNTLALALSGDYTISTSCPLSLSPATSCTAQITFTTAVLGPRPGALTITSSDPSSPTIVPLTGIGINSGTGPPSGSFTLTVNGASTATVTVTAPTSATYPLAVTPDGGYTGPVAFTCIPINPGVYATCSIQPVSVTLNGSPQKAIATITTSADSNLTLIRGNPYTLPLICAATFLIFRSPRRRRFSLLSLLLATTACGSGVSKSVRYTPAGMYQYQVTAGSTTGPPITQTVTLNLVVKSSF